MKTSSCFCTQRIVILGLCGLLAFSAACNRQSPQPRPAASQAGPKRYAFKGKVMSVDKSAGSANIDNDNIPGFMDEMVMGYTFKPPEQMNPLAIGDSITGEVVVDGEKYWLENVKVVGHAPAPPGKPTASLQIIQPDNPALSFCAAAG